MLIQDILPPEQIVMLREFYLKAPRATKAKHRIKVH
jgi:hypothetical protein